jgi:hypothetical protein
VCYIPRPMKEVRETFTKREAMQETGASAKTIERRLQPVGTQPGKHGKESLYARSDVFRLRDELGYRKPAGEPLTPDSYDTGGDSPDTALAPAGVLRIFEQIVLRQRESAASLDPWPVWMTKAKAVELSGIPASYFDRGVKAGELPHVGRGTGRRYHRDDVRRFAEKMRKPGFIEGLQP